LHFIFPVCITDILEQQYIMTAITVIHSWFQNYSPSCLWRWNRQSVPKRRHIKFRCQGITQKKTYNIQHTTYNSNTVSSSVN
jgi:hypothetical protein